MNDWHFVRTGPKVLYEPVRNIEVAMGSYPDMGPREYAVRVNHDPAFTRSAIESMEPGGRFGTGMLDRSNAFRTLHTLFTRFMRGTNECRVCVSSDAEWLRITRAYLKSLEIQAASEIPDAFLAAAISSLVQLDQYVLQFDDPALTILSVWVADWLAAELNLDVLARETWEGPQMACIGSRTLS
jgi:hypothetical protein